MADARMSTGRRLCDFCKTSVSKSNFYLKHRSGKCVKKKKILPPAANPVANPDITLDLDFYNQQRDQQQQQHGSVNNINQIDFDVPESVQEGLNTIEDDFSERMSVDSDSGLYFFVCCLGSNHEIPAMHEKVEHACDMI